LTPFKAEAFRRADAFQESSAQRLRDILTNIDLIEEFTSGLAYGGFLSDTKTVYAVVRALEIASEATRRLPDELKSRYPEIDWAAISAAGNVYRHEYEGVDGSLLWYTARNGTKPLRDMAIRELARLGYGEASTE
jgi:uncharacterized protein with HEPN domain